MKWVQSRDGLAVKQAEVEVLWETGELLLGSSQLGLEGLVGPASHFSGEESTSDSLVKFPHF